MYRYVALIAVFLTAGAAAAPLETGFTYQGQLEFNNAPANGQFDFVVELHTEATTNAQIGSTQTVSDVAVSNGVFSIELDFGTGPFAGDQLWLEIAVKESAAAGGFQGLAPRQKLTAAPYALHAEMVAANAIGSAEIVPSQVQQRVNGTCGSNQFVRQINQDGSVFCSTPVVPLPATARGRVLSNATIVSGASANVISVSYNTSVTQARYEISLTESFSINQDVAIVTLSGPDTSCPAGATARMSSVAGNLLVYIEAANGTNLQCGFNFVVYDGS